MSKSTIIKEQIMEILSDKQEHNTSDIKAAIRNKYPDLNITEGVFSNSFRSLTLAGKCINKDRGIYVINREKKNDLTSEKKNEDEEKTNKYCSEQKSYVEKHSKEYLELQNCVSEMLAKTREEFGALVKNINILDADDEVVSYVMEVRRVLEDLEKGIKR
jgi:hypothetical protein